ncbi:MAG: glycosyltransferase family A protein, partial [Bacteroidota bacterium]
MDIFQRGEYKISFCITCKNRAHHLKKTLVKNILSNQDYSRLEIVLLDYNSMDGLEQWARNELSDYLPGNRVVYYKTFDPAVFNHSHSKNVAFKLATGDIICNINSDNFIGPGFAAYINCAFQKKKNVFLRPELRMGFASGTAGVVCLNKTDFLKIGGFDERMSVYGWEDVDFINRLTFSGLEDTNIEDVNYLDAIEHGIDEKYDMNKLLSKIHEIYVSSITPLDEPSSKLLILFKNKTFKFGTVINNLHKVGLDPDYARKLVAS